MLPIKEELLNKIKKYSADFSKITSGKDPENTEIASVDECQSVIDELKSSFLSVYKDALKKEIAKIRYEKETGGISLNGVEVRTDRESQAQITSAYIALKNNLATTIDFKGANGWTTLALTEIEPIAQAITTHVQKCFSNEKLLSEQVDAMTEIEDDEIIKINEGWD